MWETDENEQPAEQATVPAEWEGKRLDLFLSSVSGLSRSGSVKLTESDGVQVNGKTASKNTKLREGDLVEWVLPEPQPCEAIPQNIPLDVVYEDSDIIVINKPKGMVVHPAAGNPDGTLVNALLYHCGEGLSGIGGVIRPGIVHRIDKDTSGLLVVAKNDASHLFLAEEIKHHRVERIYRAIVLGNMKEDSGTVDAPIGRHPTDRKKMAVIRDPEKRAREAVTHWKVLARGNADGQSFTLLECRLETGRTHQIRVHLSSLGHPLLGDEIYGGNRTVFESKHKTLIQGQCLHAGTLMLKHPTIGKEMTFFAPPPEQFTKILRILFGTEQENNQTDEDSLF